MEISNSSGKNSSSGNKAWKVLEEPGIYFQELPPEKQEQIFREYAPKIKITALRLKHKLPKHVDLEELISAGTMGLMEAVKKFDPGQKIKFETFADNRIRGAMLDELRRMDWLSRGFRKRIKKIEEVIHHFEQLHGQSPSSEKIQQETGLSAEDVDEGLSALNNQLCLSFEAVQDNYSTIMEEHRESNPLPSTVFQDIVDKLSKLIDELTHRERLVLSLYYVEELTMKEVAQVMDITEGRISQLHSQSLAKLRNKFTERFGNY
ncbi:MAG: FliA/WhiG family RNA polymerase sigma factor [Desulfonatronovibrionaceae bacterium]